MLFPAGLLCLPVLFLHDTFNDVKLALVVGIHPVSYTHLTLPTKPSV